MDSAQISEVLRDPTTLEVIGNAPLMRLSYTGLDGGPRVIPIGYIVKDETFVVCTVPSSEKVAALAADPRVAIAIDTLDPLCCLLVHGTAATEIVEGVPEEYIAASRRGVPADQFDQFEEQVRALYDSMARIVISPTWIRLNDFKRQAPRAVERLVASTSAG